MVADELERMADTDDRLRLLTVTSVAITPDLSRATVYLSSLPGPAVEALAEQRTQLQRSIGRQVRMKRTPLLVFESDPAVAHGLRVEEILRNLRQAPGDHDETPATAMSAPTEAAGPSETLGLVVVDKEAGWTSHDAVARCRRLFSQRRVGHAGTLDPDATGVLLVGLGRFTRMLRFLTGLPKSYEAEVVLGCATSTLDASGEVTGTWDMSGVTLSDVRKAAASLTGVIDQIPPMVSARKVGGRRLHELARAGIEVERAARPVTVERFDVQPSRDGEARACSASRWTARRGRTCVCSPPTWARRSAAVLTCATCVGLASARSASTKPGPWVRLTAADVLTPAQALRDLAQVELGDEMARSVSHGLALDRVSLGATGDGPWALLDRGGELLAVYEATGHRPLGGGVCVGRAG